MSEPSQETYPSSESEAPKRERAKAFAKESTRKKSSSPDNSGPRLLCDSWNIPNRQRLLIGFVGLAFLVPYSALALTYPEWSGHIGRRLSLALFSSVGQAALGFPLLLAYGVLSCAGLRTLRKTRYIFAIPLYIGVVMLLQRAYQSGGWLGRLLDRAVTAAVGPGGAWLFVGTALTLLSLGFIPRVWSELLARTGLLAEHLHERRLRLVQWWKGLGAARAEQKAARQAAAEQAKAEKEQARVETPEPVVEEPRMVCRPAVVEAFPVETEAPQPTPVSAEVTLDDATQEDVAVQATLPPLTSRPEPPVKGKGSFAQVDVEQESLELHPEPLTKSAEKQAAVPRARAFELPSIALLDDIPPAARNTPSEDKSQALLDALDAFGVKAKLLQIVRGPAVTRYELQPARGVKVSKFTSLTKDIALALASATVRIEAPIPGKSAVGIEIANKHTDLVVLKDILRDTIFMDSKGLTVALGKDLSGRPVVTDLQKMPHLLVAGTTGSGKSVCVNGLIISLLYRFTPDQLQLMMVDPKQVELSVYEDIPHLVGFSGEKGEIIVDPKKAAQALHQVVELMETRYTLFADNRVRNLAEYNAKAEQPLPWFVVIIDELADLMMVASKSVETSICRIAQKARAAGIHLVLATQRPSADVITGLIKVNIPSRAAFAVSSQVDSRVILDSSGAEHLLGKGDMLFLPVDASDPKRIQGSYVGNDEIARVVEFWKGQGLPENRIAFEYQPDLITLDDEEDTDDNSDDALLEEGLRVVLARQQASASMLQTELKVGYARARRLLIAMEKKGWVGPPEGSKPRKILYSGPAPETGDESEG